MSAPPVTEARPRLDVPQGRLLQGLRWRLLRNSWRQLQAQSPVRPLTVVLCSAVVAGFVFVVSFAGLRFLKEVVRLPPDEQLVGLLLGLLFLTLGAMLVFSSGLVVYGSLFTAPEAAFLLSTPARADRVFAYKFQGAVAFSSWAFLLLGGPVLVAYGLVCAAPWPFYALLPLFFVGYALLPGSLGALFCLLLVNYVPRRRKQFLALAVAALVAGLGAWAYALVRESRAAPPGIEGLNEAFTTLVGRVSFARSAALPSQWVARGLQAAGRGDVRAAGYYLALLWSNGLFLYLIAALASVRLYRRGFNRLATGGDLRRRHGGAWLDRLLEAGLPFVAAQTRLLIVKDFRTFRRDPQQWLLILLFGGLMALFSGNIRRLFVTDISWPYQNGLSVLCLFVVGLLLCIYTGRFVYPLLSLEGRKFWVLGLLPIRREQLLWGKFAFATVGGLVLSVGLVLLSDLMLEMPWEAVALHALTVGVLAAGLSGLSVGLGACMPNFKETDPSKIAGGFGGTLNLVVGLLFLLLTLALMAGPWHLYMAVGAAEEAPLMGPAVAYAALAGVVVGGAAVVIPLHLGVRALRRMEF